MQCYQVNSSKMLTTIPFHVTDLTIASDDNLLAVLHFTFEVTDWFTLGLTLRLPSHELERIEQDGYDVRQRQRKMVSLWLNTGNASWKTLVQALMNPLVNKEEVARRICEEHPLKLQYVL